MLLNLRLLKNKLLLLLLFLTSGLTHAAVQDVKLDNVTVFLQGAELFSSAKVTLPAGESEVLLYNVANNINEQSLLVSAGKGVLVKSFTIRKNFLTENQISPIVEKLQQQIDAELHNKELINSRLQVINAQLKLLDDNRVLSSDNVKVDAINKMLELVGVKMTQFLASRLDLEDQLKRIDIKLTKLQNQLAEEKQKQKTDFSVNQIVVKFYTANPIQTEIKLSYVVDGAGWQPTYDLYVDKINAPVKLVYKAKVFQNTGIDWNNVNLTLSTGNPSEGAQSPTLSPLYLSIYQDFPMASGKMASMPMAELQRSTDYKSEVASLSDFVKTNTNGINTSFEIALPYSIASDNKAHIVMVKEDEVKGDYRYVVTPKLDKDAFLQVQITDWSKLNLLSGKSNIFFEGNFVGQGYINTRNVREAMSLSLGRDKRIIVMRDIDAKFKSEPTFLGNNITQQYAYSIEVKNTRNEPIKLVIIDQIPVSRDSAITVTDVKYAGAEYKKETGNLEWITDVQPNANIKLPFSYTIKYPKDKQVINL